MGGLTKIWALRAPGVKPKPIVPFWTGWGRMVLPKLASSTEPTRTSTGYGYTVCTIGRTGYDATMIPTEENLCEIIIYTHVYVELNASGTISTTGDVPYRMFEKPPPHLCHDLCHSGDSLDHHLLGD
ncbi:hypothetical protein HPB49_003895 [Dermacentor silvarum]|uniref:Uncharacterized protein n=1 Tax=Dermacentor silvarum TaxID=543639 RepID=A0ACB8DMU8_DERSI|nr:hypothetical protein HPB49_003895 [Dermacentor silvarum]